MTRAPKYDDATQDTDVEANAATEADIEKAKVEAKKAQHRTSLIPIECSSFNLWTASYDFAYPFREKRESDTPEEFEKNRLETEHWFDDGFRELLELDALDTVYKRLNGINANTGSLFGIEPQGKFRFLNGVDIATRRRKLRAILWFLADYGDYSSFRSLMERFDAGKITLEDLTDD